MKKTLLLLLFLFFASCGKTGPTYRIGLDPSWYPLDIPSGKEANVLGFATDLLQEIAKREGIQLVLVFMSWDNLLPGLNEKQYDGVLSSLQPYKFNEKQYSFSAPCLMTGPVLIVPSSSPITSMNMLNNLEIGYPEGSTEEALLVSSPDVLIRTYSSIPQALTDIVMGNLDGALVGYLPAINYTQDLYADELRIATPPLDETGIRLLTLANASSLTAKFNHGFNALLQDGTYNTFATKWGLPPL